MREEGEDVRERASEEEGRRERVSGKECEGRRERVSVPLHKLFATRAAGGLRSLEVWP